MADYALMFEEDPETDAVVVFGEPGTRNEQELAETVAAGRVKKPVLALIVGSFQEAYPRGVAFGHAAAMIGSAQDSASAKRAALAAAGVHVCAALEDIPATLARLLGRKARAAAS
jgi:succinyl-CoA synthetase alpha subunit